MVRTNIHTPTDISWFHTEKLTDQPAIVKERIMYINNEIKGRWRKKKKGREKRTYDRDKRTNGVKNKK